MVTLGNNRELRRLYPGEYDCWRSMRKRCRSTLAHVRRNYRDRGITVCDRWEEFVNFLQDMGPRPDGHRVSVDRINNDGNYEPGNCRWAIPVMQCRNRRGLKLDVRLVRQIRWLHEIGYGQSAIARMYDVNHRSVNHVVNGKSWREQ